MAGDRSRYGLLVSALGRGAPGGLGVPALVRAEPDPRRARARRQQPSAELAQQFGNECPAAAGWPRLHEPHRRARGHELASLSAHQVLHDLNVLLLVLAGIALLDALVPLARAGAPLPDGAGRARGAARRDRRVLRGLSDGRSRRCALEGLVALTLREGAGSRCSGR